MTLDRVSGVTDSTGRLKLGDELCVWCAKPSIEGHPSGILPGRWRCTGCGGWQDDEYPPDDLPIPGLRLAEED